MVGTLDVNTSWVGGLLRGETSPVFVLGPNNGDSTSRFNSADTIGGDYAYFEMSTLTNNGTFQTIDNRPYIELLTEFGINFSTEVSV